MWAISPSPFGSSSPEMKTEAPFSSPCEVPVSLFSSCTPQGEAQPQYLVKICGSHSADRGIIRKCVCLKQRWILLIAWALRLWDQECD